MKRLKRSDDTVRGASTVATAQLGRVRGGASMVEYALISSTLVSNFNLLTPPDCGCTTPNVVEPSDGPAGMW